MVATSISDSMSWLSEDDDAVRTGEATRERPLMGDHGCMAVVAPSKEWRELCAVSLDFDSAHGELRY